MKLKELIGKRALLQLDVRNSYNSKLVQEFRIIEISPSQNYIKLMNLDGFKMWKETGNVTLVETLADLEKHPSSD